MFPPGLSSLLVGSYVLPDVVTMADYLVCNHLEMNIQILPS